MKYKIGQELHSCWIDEETARARFSVWVVKTIRGGKVYAAERNDFTWVKLRWGRDQEHGWAKSIPVCWRTSCPEGLAFPYLFTTKKRAIRFARIVAKNMEARRLKWGAT